MKLPNNTYIPPNLPLQALRTALGLALLFFLFYLALHYLWDLPFPTPGAMLQILLVSVAGVALGVLFSRFWPLPAQPGFERIIRLLLLIIPSLGIGLALQLFFQGVQGERALYLIFAIAAWLGSGLIVRVESEP